MTSSMIGRATRAAALAMIVFTPALATASYAFDPFGGDESLVLKSAQSAQYANPAETPLAKATADAKARASQMAAMPGVVSDASKGGGSLDLVGAGGQQDELARAIYNTGSGTDW
jgi:hypothetical protein